MLWTLRKSVSKLPEEWQNARHVKRFRLGVLFLLIYLAIIFVGECLAIYMGRHGIYNGYIMTWDTALCTIFLFGFFYLNTTTTWKRYAYIVLYGFILSYFIFEGCFYPKVVLNSNYILVTYIPYFLATLLYLTDLLLTPKSPYFKFQLQICLSVQIFSILSLVITSFHWYHQRRDLLFFQIIYYINFSSICLYYFSQIVIFGLEAFKHRRR